MRDVAHCRNWLVDMDGVLVRDDAMVEGANEFLDRLRATGRRFLVLTNNSLYAPDDLRARLAALGVEVESDQLWTSALATARFVATERPGARAFVIGAPSLHDALADAGITEDADDPDYVVLGETPDLTLAEVTTAVRLVARGAGFVASNPEPTGPSPDGPLPGVGATAAMIERAAGVAPYFVGKPNPIMIRDALDRISAEAHDSVMVGDRMETDVIAGIEAGLATVLVLSGVTALDDLRHFAYQPDRVVDSVADLLAELA